MSAEKDVTRIVKHSGDAIDLLLPLYDTNMAAFSTNKKKMEDFRWKFSPLSETAGVSLVTKNKKVTDLFKGRCELLGNGALHFNEVQKTDSGLYAVEVYDGADGHLILNNTQFQVIVLGE